MKQVRKKMKRKKKEVGDKEMTKLQLSSLRKKEEETVKVKEERKK